MPHSTSSYICAKINWPSGDISSSSFQVCRGSLGPGGRKGEGSDACSLAGLTMYVCARFSLPPLLSAVVRSV